MFLDPTPELAQLHLAVRVIIYGAVILGGWGAYSAGRRATVWGKRHRAPVVHPLEGLLGEQYLLYLRPFAVDRELAQAPPEAPGLWSNRVLEVPGLTSEEFLIKQFTGCGRVVAIGRPGERLPLLGAERGYLPLHHWQHTVSKLIQGAHGVLMFVAPGPGTVWEYTEALRTTSPERLVLMVGCSTEEFDAFRAAARQRYAERTVTESGEAWAPLPDLPECPREPRASRREWEMPLRAFITFDANWRPQVHPFKVMAKPMRNFRTVRRVVSSQVHPVLAPLAALPRRPWPPDQGISLPLEDVPEPPRRPLLGSALPQQGFGRRGRRPRRP
ncbi:hypothetical protein NGF19_08655 [Streptomyces sp. RY43-2]|uniref:Uncharacterized protein n=1 Tax=Streptomyces macrolidinus TaxID=2952607 RepID=A0ABT0ZAR4_9ACTN|nr:hypothetical protein [Streptomyces macrolidinus]MCN9240862.1 hypothetical protein [Streptomyces macrolidinus]